MKKWYARTRQKGTGEARLPATASDYAALIRATKVWQVGLARVGRNKRSTLRRMKTHIKDGWQSSRIRVGLRCANPAYEVLADYLNAGKVKHKGWVS